MTETFISDFGLFQTMIFNLLANLYTWLVSTVLGEIILFIIIMSVFLFILNKITEKGKE